MAFHLTDWLLLQYLRRLHARDRRKRDLSQFDPAKVSAVLAVSTTGLGDTVLSTPAIHALKQAFPRAKIVGHVHEKYLALTAHHPDLDLVIPYRGTYNRRYKSFFSTIRAFRRERFDAVFILHGNDPQAVPMAYLSGAPFLFRRPAVGKFDFLLSHPPGESEYFQEHAVIGRLKTVAMAGCPTHDLRLRLSPQAADREGFQRILEALGVEKGTPLIAFQVGASYPYKCWPPDHFQALGRALLEKDPRRTILILGNKKEKRLARRIRKGIQGRAFNLAGRLTLAQTLALILEARLLVTNDTGPLHLAVALGTRTVSFFGPTDPALFGPLQDLERHIVLYHKPDCLPCRGKRCRDPRCLAAITVEEALKACEDHLHARC
jgi:ADP-heptose:LPS heptosyltransferase